MSVRYTQDKICEILGSGSDTRINYSGVVTTDVFIAGSGPIACAFARKIIEERPSAQIYMAEIGAQENPIPGAHQKNSIKYQRDIDAFVNVIKGALQPVSIPPSSAFHSTLGTAGWNPPVGGGGLVLHGFNPSQEPEVNLRGTAITRAVGGMATHWTCSCPIPHPEETINSPIPRDELVDLLGQAGSILNVNENEFEISMRHREIKRVVNDEFPDRGVKNIPLAVKRRETNEKLVTWTGSNTVLGDTLRSTDRLTIQDEMRVTKVIEFPEGSGNIEAALVRDLRTNDDVLVFAKTFIVACGAICTPQILWNSRIRPPALGHYLSEQSMAFCQVVLKRSIVDAMVNNPDNQDEIKKHKEKYPDDPLLIPFDDPEPQLMIGYSEEHKYHVQIHRDAFSYGDVGPRADPRVVLDFRFFGKQDIKKENRVTFPDDLGPFTDWRPRVTDTYGMPQPTFYVQRSDEDGRRDQEMMADMTKIALSVGPFLPGSYPQFMEPGLALHITGTTRVGTDSETSVADANSRVHGFKNLWVGGNNVIPDATASNPTRTSIAYAIKAARDVVSVLNSSEA